MTLERNTPSRDGNIRNDPVAAGAVIYAGALVALDSNGNAVAGAKAIALTVRGIAQQTVDNSNGADGDARITSRAGVFRLANADLTRRDIKQTAYFNDDDSVTKTIDGSFAVGTIIGVDNRGAWVRID